MDQETGIALVLTTIVVVNGVKNLIWAASSRKRRHLFVPQLKFEAKFVPAMLVGAWGIRALL